MAHDPTTEAQKRKWAGWFEIPATDFERAKSFYETIFDISIQATSFGGIEMGIFPHSQVGCAICSGPGYEPGNTGPIVCLNANPDLQVVLDRIEAAGGKILLPKIPISPEYGFMARFLDSEGNRLALQSNQ